MKKLTYAKISLMTLLTIVMLAPATMAGQIEIWQGAYSKDSGGEFVITGLSSYHQYYSSTALYKAVSGAPTGFASFCLEAGEYFNPSTLSNPHYYNYSISDAAIGGGAGGGPGGDKISMGTAWLYKQFAAGTLTDYFNGSRLNNAGLLQQTIHFLEGEITSLSDYKFYNQAQAALNALGLNILADANGAFGVHVLNVTYPDGTRAQDQLIITPEPGTLLLLGVGLAGLAAFRRRSRKA